jgi:FAD/FMN-containing dehydrogenase
MPPPKNPFAGIIDSIGTALFGKPKARVLFEQLKADPYNKNITDQVRDLYKKDPLAVIIEVLRRVAALIPQPQLPSVSQAGQFDIFRQTWQNTIFKERVQPLQYLRPTTRQELINIVMTAEQTGLFVRAVGTGHSFSDVANATDILVDMRGVKNVLVMETDTLKAGIPVLFNCEAGMLVEKLNTELDKLGLALPTMAAFDQETIYGAVATSTHGTGLNVPGMAAMIRSMDIIATGGKCYRVEPKDGVTDAAKFKRKYPHGEITLIQDNDKFYSSVVGFGLMGIVYSVVIEPVKAFYLKQRLWVTNWSTVKKKLEDRSFFVQTSPSGTVIGNDPATQKPLPTRAQVFVNPYTTKKQWELVENHTCVIQVQTEITKAEFDLLNAQATTQNKGKLLAFVTSLVTNGAVGAHDQPIKAEDANNITEEISTNALLELLNTFPTLTPLFLDISLIVLLSGSGKFGKSYTVMNQGKLAIKNAGYSVEPGLAVDKNNNFIKGAEEIMKEVTLSQGSHSYLTAPICLRFVMASKDYLSPEYEMDTCMIDVPMMLGTVGDDQMLQRMQLDLIALGARPHWGKICNLVNGKELVKKMYPKFDKFQDTIAFFNPKGTFNSSFSFRTGMSAMNYQRE